MKKAQAPTKFYHTKHFRFEKKASFGIECDSFKGIAERLDAHIAYKRDGSTVHGFLFLRGGVADAPTVAYYFPHGFAITPYKGSGEETFDGYTLIGEHPYLSVRKTLFK